MGSQDDKISFKDIADGLVNKKGYEKLRFCGKQARCDNLQYFWIDTCCIDKSNSTELAKSLGSMFRWYQNAVKC
jgi:hypothetical protein